LGCNNFGARIDDDATRAVIHKALDLGITLFDTADTYGERGGSETVMGKILGDDRKRIVLATKFGMPMDDVGVKVGGARRYIMQAVEDSLRRLRTDWFDLYQIHQPDPRTPIEETLRSTTWYTKGRCATSAAPTSPPGRWSRRNGPRRRTT
jgi:aryl-alcohol dehydrogenase-like predicted oxidoreductase